MQQRSFQKIIKSLILIFSLFLTEEGSATLSFETTSAAKANKPVTIATPTPKPSDTLTKTNGPALEKPVILDDEKSIKESLKRYDLILSQEKKLNDIISLQFNRIVCFMQLARISRIKNGGKTLVKEEEKYLKTALDIIEYILKIKNISVQVTSQMYYFKGLCYLDLGLKQKSRDYFEKAIITYPNAKYVTSLSLYFADLLYDERKLPEALIAYRKYYSKMSPEEKDLADYKVSWIYLNQSKMDQAVDLFLTLVNRSTSQSMIQDSINSLPIALCEKFDQDFILEKLEKSHITEEHKIEVLAIVYENFLKQPEKERSRILDKIVSSKVDGEIIVKLLTIEIQMMRFEDNINKEVANLLKIQKYFYQNLKKVKSYGHQTLTILGEELERLIAKSLGQYQKAKNESRYQILSLTIDIYLKLNSFGREVEVTSLLIDLLVETNKDEQLMTLCMDILVNPKLSSLKNKAKLQILLGYEKKYLLDSKNYETKFFNLVKIYLKDLKADQWENVAQKFSDYLVKANLNSDAEEIYQKLYIYNPKFEYFLRLVSIKFELKKCPEIISLLSDKKDLDKKLVEYKRECYLVVAQDSKATKKPFETYQQNILEFIALSTGAKKNAAIADYLKTMKQDKDTKENEKYHDLLDHHFFEIRFEKEIFPIYQQEILHLIEIGEFSKSLVYLNNCEKNESCKEMRPLQVSIKQVQLLDTVKINNPLKNQHYDGEIGKYLLLIQPEDFLQHATTEKNSKQYSDPRILLLAARLANVDWSDPKSKTIYNQVLDLLGKDEKPVTFSPTWQKIIKINFPKEKIRNRLKDQDIMFLMKMVQQTRKSLLSDLGQYSVNSQKILLNKAMETEIRMGEVIKTSPIPTNLDSSKIKEYEEGLRQLSEEFDLQASSYLKSLANLDLQKVDLATTLYSQLKVPDVIEKWDWGSKDEPGEKIKKLVQDEQYMQALFYLDYLISSSKINNEDYYVRRSGVLLFSAIKRNKILPMIKYVWEECETNKQMQILNAWKERGLK